MTRIEENNPNNHNNGNRQHYYEQQTIDAKQIRREFKLSPKFSTQYTTYPTTTDKILIGVDFSPGEINIQG